MLIVGIEQDYDLTLAYCQAFRRKYVYAHPPRHTLIPCFNANAIPSHIYPAVQQSDVRFITGSGHGPFHPDAHMSFAVNREGEYFNCFAGCGGGDVIDFYRRLKGLSHKDAVRELLQWAPP